MVICHVHSTLGLLKRKFSWLPAQWINEVIAAEDDCLQEGKGFEKVFEQARVVGPFELSSLTLFLFIKTVQETPSGYWGFYFGLVNGFAEAREFCFADFVSVGLGRPLDFL